MNSKLINIGKEMRAKGAKKEPRFNNMVKNLSYTKTKDIYETLVELCLMYNIDCEALIELKSENDEESLRKHLYNVISN